MIGVNFEVTVAIDAVQEFGQLFSIVY